MIILKYEKRKQTVDLETRYKEIECYIKEDIEAVNTRDRRYRNEKGEFAVDDLLSNIYEYREAQSQIKEMLKVPFDVLVVVEREGAKNK